MLKEILLKDAFCPDIFVLIVLNDIFVKDAFTIEILDVANPFIVFMVTAVKDALYTDILAAWGM